MKYLPELKGSKGTQPAHPQIKLALAICKGNPETEETGDSLQEKGLEEVGHEARGAAIGKSMHGPGPSWMVSQTAGMLHLLLQVRCCFHAEETVASVS